MTFWQIIAAAKCTLKIALTVWQVTAVAQGS